MIDRIALERIYQDLQCQNKIEEFYSLLVEYTQNHQTKKIEDCLNSLNLLAKMKKSRPIYYDNHCLKTDLDQFIVETYRIERKKKSK